MVNQSHRERANGEDFDGDLRIRQLLIRRTLQSVPTDIESRVLRKVGRRKRIVRASGAAAAAIAMVAAGFLIMAPLTRQPPQNSVAETESPLSRTWEIPGQEPFAESEMVAVSASAPVAPLALVYQNQLSLLECLKSLTEE